MQAQMTIIVALMGAMDVESGIYLSPAHRSASSGFARAHREHREKVMDIFGSHISTRRAGSPDAMASGHVGRS